VITLICFILSGFLWIYAGASLESSTTTSLITNWYTDLNLTFLPVLIGQCFFACAITSLLVIKKSTLIKKRTAYSATMILSIVTTVLTICSLYSFFETSSKYEMGDMNFAAWMVVIGSIIGTVCAIVNYVQSKKN
jgi:hypothetical protein